MLPVIFSCMPSFQRRESLLLPKASSKSSDSDTDSGKDVFSVDLSLHKARLFQQHQPSDPAPGPSVGLSAAVYGKIRTRYYCGALLLLCRPPLYFVYSLLTMETYPFFSQMSIMDSKGTRPSLL